MHRDVEAWIANQPERRQARLRELCSLVMAVEPKAEVSFQYKMPSFMKADGGVSVGNQKNYVCVYFCAAHLVENIRMKHPDLNIGVGCVRIRDTQDVPLTELRKSLRLAFRGA